MCKFCQDCCQVLSHLSCLVSPQTSLLQVSKWPDVLSLLSLFSLLLTSHWGGINDVNTLFSQILVWSRADLRTDVPAALYMKGCRCGSCGCEHRMFVGFWCLAFCGMLSTRCLATASMKPLLKMDCNSLLTASLLRLCKLCRWWCGSPVF